MDCKNLNSSIPAEFWEYLEDAGFTYRPTIKFHGVFTRGQVDILVSHLDLEVRHNGPADRVKVYSGDISGPVYKFSGLDHISALSFMFLMEITKAVPMKELLKDAGVNECRRLALSLCELFPEDIFLAAPTWELNTRSDG